MDGLPASYCIIVEDCIESNMTKDETIRYVQDNYQIPPQHTNRVWDYLQSMNPDLFIAYHARMPERDARIRERDARIRERDARIRERNARILERNARIQPLSASEERGEQAQRPFRRPRALRHFWNSPNYQRNLVIAASPQVPQEEEQRLSPPPPSPARRSLWTDTNVQRDPPASPQVRQEAATALENQNVQSSQQEAAYPNDFWQQLLTTLGQIQSNTQHLGHIQSNTDQMVKLLTDGHGSGPHPSAAGSSKRQRVGEAEERCNNEEAEKQQKKEEGDNEGTQEKEEGDNEELQEKKEGNHEEVQRKEEGNDEEVQKNERGDNE